MNKRRDLEGYDTEAFVAGVLGRTAGAACTRAEAQLEDLLDGRLGDLNRQLVQSHLEHCVGCRQVAVTLGWLSPLLPAMATLEPPADFTAGVLARTSGAAARRQASLHPTGPAGLMDRLGRWWEGRIMRPGFAVQVAYAATVLLVLLTTVPGSPLQGVPRQALQVVGAGAHPASLLDRPLDRANAWLAAGVASGANAGWDGLARAWYGLDQELARRSERAAAERVELDASLRALSRGARRGDLGLVGYEALNAARVWPKVWRQWWGSELPPAPPAEP